MVLSTVTVLGLRLAVTSHAAAQPASQSKGAGLGFTALSKPAPAVSLPSLTGSGTISVAGLAGKPIVLNFWSSTCVDCRKETPAIASVARTLGGKVAFFGIDSVDRQGPAAAFASKYRVPYALGFDPKGTAAIAYDVVALPVTFFLSPSGKKILGENIGALTRSELTTILHKLYGTSTT